MDAEEQFVVALKADPSRSHQLVFADWLEEQGRTSEAEVIRTRADKVVSVADLRGRILASATRTADEMTFMTIDGEQYRFYHDQDCCESVGIEDVCGNLDDLVGFPLLMAEETTSGETPADAKSQPSESFTWTFYRFATVKGYVTVRWLGESSGYYSEEVSFRRVESC